MDSSTTRRVLVLFAHPALEKSRVNRRLISVPRALDGVTFHDLYEAYPDFLVRVDREQELLEEHDVIVFQHPIFWYSTPSLLKEWIDLVLEHGWAYGSEGTALEGKWWLHAVSTGGREQAYGRGGYNRYALHEFMRPLEQTARLCGLEYLPPFAVQGTHGMDESTVERHVGDYGRLLRALRDDRVDLDAAQSSARLNADLDAVLRPEGDNDGGSDHAR